MTSSVEVPEVVFEFLCLSVPGLFAVAAVAAGQPVTGASVSRLLLPVPAVPA